MKILVGMSGGVDSACAAKLLKDAGHSVVGASLIMHEYGESEAAAAACSDLGMEFCEIDVSNSFNLIIKNNFIYEYSHGRTPNPCILCNERVKFRHLYDYAIENGFDAIATGHYAGVVRLDDASGQRYAIRMSEDRRKDQSYMLYRLPEDILSRLVLPLSGYKKDEIRTYARNNGISAADRPDSQEICFLPNGGHADYIESVLGDFPHGNFIDESGRILGKHKGIIRYTVGQRKGLGISLGDRAFVTNIDPLNNTITLSSEFCGRKEVHLSDTVFSGLAKPDREITVKAFVKIRYTAPLASAEALLRSDGTALLKFDEPVKAAPGQSAVLYDESGVVLVGGIIR